MEERGESPLLPPVSHQYLVKWWLAAGATLAGGMGETPLSWQEIEAWARQTDIELEPWEAEAIHRMSGAFLTQRYEARNLNCAAPYSIEAEEAARTAERLAGQFKAMMAAVGKRGPT